MGTLILFYTNKAFTWFQRTWNVAHESYKFHDIYKVLFLSFSSSIPFTFIILKREPLHSSTFLILCSTEEISHTGLDGHDDK